MPYLEKHINEYALTDSLGVKLGDAINDVDSLLSRAHRSELDTLSMRLNSPKMRIITFLSEAGQEGMSLTDIAKKCLREPSTVSSLLLKLEFDNLVSRIPGKKREKCRFILTEQGNDIISNRVKNSSISMFFDPLSTEEKVMLLKLLQKLVTNGKDMLGIDFVPKFMK